MARLDPHSLLTALGRLHARTLQEPHLAAEAQRARREFFGPRLERGTPSATAEQRFQEWFLLERESERLGEVPAVAFADEGIADELDDSQVSVFSIRATPEGTIEALDLQDDDTYELNAPEGALLKGDMMVGRVHPDPAGGWMPSAAVAVYRPGEVLAAAFRRDLEQLQIERRLTQIELEHLLLARQPGNSKLDAPPIEHLEAVLERVLREGGSKHSAAEISEALADAVRMGPVIGPLLDELAFDTKVDLEPVRQLLIELWNAHHVGDFTPHAAPAAAAGAVADDDDAGGPPGETLGERLVRELDQGLAEKQDVEELFRRLEAMAGIEPDEEEDDDPLVSAAQAAAGGSLDVGDLDPLVQEYLWETDRQQAPEAQLFAQWIELQQNAAVPHIDLESVTGEDLQRLLLHVYLAAEPAARAAAVRAAFTALREFYAWAEVTQEIAVRSVLEQGQGTLFDQVDRLQAAGLALSGSLSAKRHAGTCLLHVEDLGDQGFGVRNDEGEHHWLPTARATVALLREGDLLLGAVTAESRGAAFAGLVIVLPADAEKLIS